MLKKEEKEMLSKKVVSVIGIDKLNECTKVQLEMMDSLMDHLQPIDLPKEKNNKLIFGTPFKPAQNVKKHMTP